MKNRYKIWQNLLIIFTILIAIIYCVPNLFQDKPAIEFRANQKERVIQTLKDNDVKNYIVNKKDVTFTSTEDQLFALTLLQDKNISASLFLKNTTPSFLKNLNAYPMKLGLDLRGGVHLLLQADIDEVIKKDRANQEKNIIKVLRNKKVRAKKSNGKLIFSSEKARDVALYEMQTNIFAFKFSPSKKEECDKDGCKTSYIIDYLTRDEHIQNLKESITKQTILTLKKRVNELGVSEAVVQSYDGGKIAVDLPGLQDASRAKNIIGKTAALEFRIVSDEQSSMMYPYKNSKVGLQEDIILSGDSISNAQASIDDQLNHIVQVSLSSSVENRFNQVTKENVGNAMAVLMLESKKTNTGKTVKTSKVISVATIQSALGSNFSISGLNEDEAKDLSLLLRAGSMPTTVNIVEETVLGPSLGQENITKGINALILGIIIVSVFMAVYYKGFGMIANIAIVINLVCLLALLSIVGVTLTLSGIAAIVLTLGMAIDANVLIYERIKEELQINKNVQNGIFVGFNKAFATILDANVTTFIVGAVLLTLGSGPIQAFAVTLILGLITSMFTAVICTKALVNLFYGNSKEISLG